MKTTLILFVAAALIFAACSIHIPETVGGLIVNFVLCFVSIPTVLVTGIRLANYADKLKNKEYEDK